MKDSFFSIATLWSISFLITHIPLTKYVHHLLVNNYHHYSPPRISLHIKFLLISFISGSEFWKWTAHLYWSTFKGNGPTYHFFPKYWVKIWASRAKFIATVKCGVFLTMGGTMVFLSFSQPLTVDLPFVMIKNAKYLFTTGISTIIELSTLWMRILLGTCPRFLSKFCCAFTWHYSMKTVNQYSWKRKMCIRVHYEWANNLLSSSSSHSIKFYLAWCALYFSNWKSV